MSDVTTEHKGDSEFTFTLNKDQLSALATQILENHGQLKQRLQELQTLVDHLRLMATYQAFDLEATRRENDDLRTLLALDL